VVVVQTTNPNISPGKEITMASRSDTELLTEHFGYPPVVWNSTFPLLAPLNLTF
jgi:hypothetical protein